VSVLCRQIFVMRIEINDIPTLSITVLCYKKLVALNELCADSYIAW
jgi:hypothetical protein